MKSTSGQELSDLMYQTLTFAQYLLYGTSHYQKQLNEANGFQSQALAFLLIRTMRQRKDGRIFVQVSVKALFIWHMNLDYHRVWQQLLK